MCFQSRRACENLTETRLHIETVRRSGSHGGSITSNTGVVFASGGA